MKRKIKKRCERCQQEFICGLFGCWCSEVEVTDSHYEKIIAHYHDCLCSSCLSQMAGNSSSDLGNQELPPPPSHHL